MNKVKFNDFNTKLKELTNISIFDLVYDSYNETISYETLIPLVYVLKNTVFPENYLEMKFKLIKDFNECIKEQYDYNLKWI